MPDATYDVVIIGAGHNGMALAAYLAKSRWKVAVFEQRGEEGGGLCTEELTRPGFLHYVHANYHTLVGICPVYNDYRTPIPNLYKCGARQHPHGFVTFAPAYNALEAIAEDHHLERWWT